MKKYSFVTAKFKSYVNSCKKNNEPMTLVTSKDGENVYFVNGYTAFKCPSMYYKTDLQEIFHTDAPAPGKRKELTERNGNSSDPANLVENAIEDSKNIVTRTNITLQNVGNQYNKRNINIFAAEQNGIVIDEFYLDMYNITNASFYSVGKPTSIVIAQLCDGVKIVFLPVRMSKEQDFINSICKLWKEHNC